MSKYYKEVIEFEEKKCINCNESSTSPNFLQQEITELINLLRLSYAKIVAWCF